MGTVDLRDLRGGQIVIHFGGALTSVDAYTFANSLVAFADTVRAVNAAINAEQSIEIRLEAVGPGSFRAAIRRIHKGIGGFFSRGAESIIWAIIGALIYDNILKGDYRENITVKTDEVIIRKGADRIIIPRAAYEQLPAVRNNPEIQRNLERTFQVIEDDPAIENFGITANLSDPEPMIQIPRSDFPLVATTHAPLAIEETERVRLRTENARLIILKAWFSRGNRKWTFEWNGMPLSAPIRDAVFWDRVERRELLFGKGDALDVEIMFKQVFNEELGVFENDHSTFHIVKVLKVVPRSRSPSLPFDS